MKLTSLFTALLFWITVPAFGFEINNTPPDLTNWLTSPNGFNSFTLGSTISVTINGSIYNPGGITAELYKGSVRVAGPSTSGLNNSFSTTGLSPGMDYRVRIFNASNPAEEDWSNNYFSIVPTNFSNWLQSPNGGQVIKLGNSISVTWDALLYNPSSILSIEIYKGATKVAGPVVGGTGPRTISTTGLTSGTDYKIKIYDTNNPTRADMSDANFTIVDLDNWLTAPAGGATFAAGASISVAVNTSLYSPPSGIIVEMYKGSVKVVGPFQTAPSGGSISTAGMISGSDYRVRVYSFTDPSLEDWSTNFTITGLESWLQSPNGGEVYNVGAVVQLGINSTLYSPGTVKAYVYKGSVLVKEGGGGGISNYNISFTDLIPGTDYRIKVENAASSSAYDFSDNTFSILDFTDWLTTPDGGTSVKIGSNLSLLVNTDKYNPAALSVELYKGITKVYGPVSGATTGRIIATTGFTAGTDYRVRIFDTNKIQLEDWSYYFTLEDPNVSTDKNYVKTDLVTTGGLLTDTDVTNATFTGKQTAIQFLDDLGRPLQTKNVNASPGQRDVIMVMEYDAFGREAKKYLPFVNSVSTGTSFETGAVNEVLLYYASPGYGVAGDANPYAKTILENSPLSRVIKQGAPGQAWQPDATNTYASTDHTVKKSYTFNVLNEVIAWTYTYPDASYPLGKVNSGSGSVPVYYAANELQKTGTKDEHGNEVLEYTDKQGRVVLKRVQVVAGTPAVNDVNYASSYYIYNPEGNLIAVIPPQATALITQTSPVSEYFNKTDTEKEAFMNRWSFRYAYDGRSRMTHKQVPGSETVYMVYDHRNRLVLTQDANQRAGATNAVKYWTFTKYDELNRPILTGIKDTTTTVQLTQAQMQAAVDAHYAKAWTKYGETYLGNVAGNVHGYSNKSYPVFTTAGTLDVNKYLTVTYYDNYSFRSLWTGTYTYVDENLSETVNGITYNQPDAEFAFIKGQVTGTKVKVLDGGNNWLKSITYYDDDYRPVQTIADNQTGGTDLTTTVYDFTGKPLETKATHRALWRDRIGVSVSANTITKTAASTTWGTAGTASVRALPASTNGYIEFTVNDLTSTRMIGFAVANENADYKTIDFIVYLNNATLYAYERDVSRGSKGTVAVGDVIRLDRTGTSMKIYKNGTAIYTFPTASSTALYADCSLGSIGSALTGITLSWAPETHTVTRRFTYDHAGRLINTWHTLDSGPEILLTKNVYNELGQLIDKKLHSTLADGSDAKQSVDYRYNIRGWLTKINESDLTTSTESGEARDLFGVELGYNTDMGISNTQLYNGNISGIKWSNNLSLGTVTENAYTYSYDAMNRIIASAYKQKESTWATAANNGFAETGFTYDLNGNIKTLQRNDQRASGWMDNLTYNYGTGATQSNKLLSVTDAGDDFKGFIEGTNGAGINDYTYDANGNMITDLNKGILTNLPIIYNYLNLPETVSKGTSTIRYVYDATGRKLSQTVAVTGPQKQTDYIGEYVYTNGALQFVGHEEGRIVLASEEKVFSFDGSHQTNISKSGTDVTLTNETTNGETYLKASITAGATKRGITALTAAIPVTAGERYVYRVRGYRGGEAIALYVKGNSTDLIWPGASLPNNINAEAWVETYFTIPAGVTQIETGVLLNSSTTGTHFYYINAAELIKLSSNTPEYQYHLKDHLGNVRMTFTTKQQTETYTASFETSSATAEDADFSPSYDNVTFSSAAVYASSGTRSQRLSASPTEMVGLSKSLSVMPGDTIDIKVYAKYFTPTNTNSTVSTSTLAAAIASGFGLSPTSTGEALKAYTSLNQMFTAGGMMIGPGEWEDDNAPKAYLNFILFDKDFIPYDMGWDQIAIEALENGTDVDHDLLELSAVVREPGYIYIYLSNENNKIVDVYFDDLTIKHHLGPVVQQDDYYAFGLTFNSYSSENSTPNDYKYNGKELQDELGLNWLDYGARMYQSEIGRWSVIDPKADLLEMSSPYVYSLNSPVNFIDKDGELPIYINGRVSNDSERGSSTYWDTQLLRTIASSGIPNPGGTVMFVDGDRGTYPNMKEPDQREFNNLNSVSSFSRRWAGEKAGREDFKKILSQLAKDPKTGKITEKIQIYTHSRGAAFGEGYTNSLLEMIKENADLFEDADNVIDFVYNMAPHQSSHLTAPEGVDSYSHDHSRDKFSDNDMKGLKGAFTSSEKSSGMVGAHSTSSFVKDVGGFLKSFQETGGKESKKLIRSFISRMKNEYGIEVAVK